MKKLDIEELQALYSLLTTEPFLERSNSDTLTPEMIKEIRKAAKITQEEFAFLLGLRGGKSTVSGWETGKTKCAGISAVAVTLAVEDMVRQWDSAPLIKGVKSTVVSVSHLEMYAIRNTMRNKTPFEVAAGRLPKVDIVFMKHLPSSSDSIVFQVAYRDSK